MSLSTNLRSIIAIFLMTLISAPMASAQGRTRADLIVSGGTIVTMDNQRRVIEDGAIAVSGGRIVAVGSRAEIEKNYSARETVDARGRVVIPGLINGHTHVPM